MEQEHGPGMTTALDRARLPMTGALTKPQAMGILKLAYPKAPENQIIRAAIFCRDFGLHPLAKEVFLIPYNEGTPKETWAMVVGIPANRKVAHNRKGDFSFLDDTPRAATDAEVIKQFGPDSDEARFNIISITQLRGVTGNLATGFGLYRKGEKPKGTEKGNTARNMANHRSERIAMDRLPGPALPQYEVVDERYMEEPDVDKAIDVPGIGKVVEATGEIIEGEVLEVKMESITGLPNPETLGSLSDKMKLSVVDQTPEAKEADSHFCQEHGCAFDMKQRGSSIWYSHKTDDPKCPKGFCNEAKKKETPAPEPEPEPEPEPINATLSTLQELQEAMALCNWSYSDVGKYCNAQRGWGIKAFADLKPDQMAEVIAAIKNNPK